MAYRYRIYGFYIESDIKISLLKPQDFSAAMLENKHVTISFGNVPDISHYIEIIDDDDFVLSLNPIVRFQIKKRSHIIVQPILSANTYLVQRFILTIALAGLLHQCHILPLHANAIQTPHGAVLLMGDSGAGKSTATTAACHRGYGLISDDIAAIKPITEDQTSIQRVIPGYPYIKIYRDIIETVFKHPIETLRRDLEFTNKYNLPVKTFDSPLHIHRIYHIISKDVSTPYLDSIDGLEKIALLTRQVYQQEIASKLGLFTIYTPQLVQLARTVPIHRLYRPVQSTFEDFQHLIEIAERDWSTP